MALLEKDWNEENVMEITISTSFSEFRVGYGNE